MRVNPADSMRPDPNEPWRYECPKGHTTVEKRKQLPAGTVPKSPRDKDPDVGARGGHRPEGTYYCQPCGAGYDELLDKKTGEAVQP